MYRTVAVRFATKKVTTLARGGAKPGGSVADHIESSVSTSSSVSVKKVKVGSATRKSFQKKDLAAAMALKHDLNPIQSKRIIETVFGSIFDSIRVNKTVHWDGLGIFQTIAKRPTTRRHPRSKELKRFPATVTVTFSALGPVKEKL